MSDEKEYGSLGALQFGSAIAGFVIGGFCGPMILGSFFSLDAGSGHSGDPATSDYIWVAFLLAIVGACLSSYVAKALHDTKWSAVSGCLSFLGYAFLVVLILGVLSITL